LRSLPFGPTRVGPWMRRPGAARAQARRHGALDGVALTARNSHQISPHLPGAFSGRNCPRPSWAVACEGMCWEQSRLQRTIATSRSEATTTETNPEEETTASTQDSLRPTNRKDTRLAPGAPVTQKPRGKPLPLDKLFQERSDTPTPVSSTGSRGPATPLVLVLEGRCHRPAAARLVALEQLAHTLATPPQSRP